MDIEKMIDGDFPDYPSPEEITVLWVSYGTHHIPSDEIWEAVVAGIALNFGFRGNPPSILEH